MITMAQTKETVNQTADGILRRGTIEGHTIQGMDIAAFDGSFAPGTRPTTRRIVPWYRDREYFFGCWLLPAVWKSAVSGMC